MHYNISCFFTSNICQIGSTLFQVLGMEQLPPPKQWRFARKRRRDSSSGEVLDGEAAEEKKDKKEEGETEVV